MIFESWPWRQELLRDAAMIEKWKDRPFTERRNFLIEKKVFTTAYVMRKLMDSLKLTTDQSKFNVVCREYPCLKRPTLRDRWEWYEHYDLEHSTKSIVAGRDLYNMIVHSFVFTEYVTEEEKSRGFLINSDLRRETALWEVAFEDYVDLIRRVAHDNPPHFTMRYDWQKEDWVVWMGDVPPPEFG